MYSTKDLAVIIPTKDRPELVRRLLKNLVEQNCAFGRVIVVASGTDIKNIVLSFANNLPVEYYKSEPGQIRQRNLGISLLNESTKLVLALDDDILLFNNAIVEIINCWNTVEASTAGIGCNMITEEKDNYITEYIKSILWPKGKVLVTGKNMPMSNLKENIKTQWLPGGFSIWRQKILFEFPQNILNTSFAAGEDLRFSYPIGKKYDLYSCANAKVTHDIIYDQETSRNIHYFRGYQNTLGFLHFSDSYPELSFFLSVVSNLFNCLVRLILGVPLFSSAMFNYAKGQFAAIVIAIKAKWEKESILLYMDGN